MTKQTVSIIPKRKVEALNELKTLIETKKTILLVDVAGMPGAQYQLIAKKMREKAILRVPKKNILFRALDESGIENIENLKDKYKGAVAIMFSDEDSFDLALDLIKKKSPSKAKAGQIAPTDIEVPAGPTDLTPGPAISELGALGIQIMIKAGKIEIKDAKVVAKEGDTISEGAAAILGKLNILPFTIGFSPLSAFDLNTKTFYPTIEINSEEAKENLLEAYSRALPFAVEIGYYTEQTTPLMIQKASAYENKLIRVITGEPEEVIEEQAAPAQEEEKQEEPKEEPKADFAASFF